MILEKEARYYVPSIAAVPEEKALENVCLGGTALSALALSIVVRA